MKSKKGMSTISIVCFLGMISIVSLSILVLEINKYDLIKIGSQENLAIVKAEEEIVSILHSFKNKIESDCMSNNQGIEKLNYDEENYDNLKMDEEIELSEKKLSMEQAVKSKFENMKGFVKHRDEAPYLEVQLKKVLVGDIEFFYYNYRIDDTGITFIEY